MPQIPHDVTTCVNNDDVTNSTTIDLIKQSNTYTSKSTKNIKFASIGVTKLEREKTDLTAHVYILQQGSKYWTPKFQIHLNTRYFSDRFSNGKVHVTKWVWFSSHGLKNKY